MFSLIWHFFPLYFKEMFIEYLLNIGLQLYKKADKNKCSVKFKILLNIRNTLIYHKGKSYQL